MTVFVINIGDLEYGKYSIPLIKKLCDYNNINLFVLENNIKENIYNHHPSWLKLFCHDLIEDDFIISWDLDLVPLKLYDLKCIFDTNMLNLSYDTGVLYKMSFFNEKFKYNCGLMGIPSSFKESLHHIYSTNGINPRYPSYEQYYINDYIYDNNICVNEIDNKYNTLYNTDLLIDDVINQHFTWTVYANDKEKLIKSVYDNFPK